MSTRKLSDKEFDRYTRNILKKPEGIAFDEAAWAAMEGSLAAAPKGGAFPFKWVILSAGTLILLGALTYSWVGQSKIANTESVNLAQERVTSEDVESNTSGNTVAAKIENDDLAQAVPTTDTQAYSNSSNESAVAETSTNPGADLNSSRTENMNETFLTQVSDENDNTDESRLEFLAGDQEKDENNDLSSEKIKSDDNLANELFLDSRGIVLYYARVEDPTLIETLRQHTSDTIYEEPIIPLASRMNVGITLAPDFSTVGQLSEFDAPGIDFGISFEYFVQRRLSLTTGAFLTRKIYRTSDLTQYEIPQGFWTDGQLPDEINANCQVIDIPVNLRYRVIEGARTSLFISAGISSYLMLNEKYGYDYGTPYPGSRVSSWEVQNENNHFFGVYNISAGLSRKISSKISFEVEPYIKNSLGGVGWGNVLLKSTGAHFNLKYHFNTN